MDDDAEILRNLLSGSPTRQSDWAAFLNRFSNLILKVIWQFDRDYDEVMEKYLFVCKKLAENDFARIRKYHARDGQSPLFTTWLAAVAHNLCIDAHRSRHGRKQLPRAIMRLEEFDREVFRLYYWRGYSLEDLEQRMRGSGKDPSLLATSIERIQRLLAGGTPVVTPPVMVPLDENDVHTASRDNDADLAEMQVWLQQWMDKLNDQERMIIRLRFWEDMTGPEIAQAMKISPGQRVYPLLQKALASLREEATRTYGNQNAQSASV